ncbi:nuclear transport factor 2 family protein [Amycolatopsis sp. NPDC049688]|uniref:nuclear transport factor 2 family protein n=1 Tax=Amycolatopsis sp. NPDC049688 TaxID=3154733 RepID=UPI003429254E
MTDVRTLVEQYIAVWNETDGDRRRALIADVFTADAGYTDPLGAVAGHDGIDQFVAGAQQQFGGLTFSLPAGPDAHHDLARFQWHLGTPGAEPVAIGFDVVELEDGKIAKVHGFLDKLPG